MSSPASHERSEQIKRVKLWMLQIEEHMESSQQLLHGLMRRGPEQADLIQQAWQKRLLQEYPDEEATLRLRRM